MKVTREMSGFLRTVGESGQKEFRRSLREAQISEKAGKHTEEERSSGQGAGPGSTSARNQILQVTFVS